MPVLPPSSPLKILTADSCSIQKVPPSYLRPGISLDLSYNKITELPREATIDYLINGGKLGTELGVKLFANPLAYPPKSIYEMGAETVLK